MSGSRFICTATLLFYVTLTAAPNDARAMYRGGGHFNPGGGAYRPTGSPYAPGGRGNGAPGNVPESDVGFMRNGGPNGFHGDGQPYSPGPGMSGYGYGEPPPWRHRNVDVENPRESVDEPVAGYGDTPAHGHWPPPRWPHRPVLGDTPVIVDAPEGGDGGDETPTRWRTPHYVAPVRPPREPTVVYEKPPVVVSPPVQPKPQPRAVYTNPPVVSPPPAPPKPQPRPTFAYAKPPSFVAPPPKPPTPGFAARAALPLSGETRFRSGEVLVETAYATPEARVAEVLRRHGLTEVEVARIDLLRVSLRRWRIPDARTATAVVSELAQETALARAQPNYLFAPADEASPAPRPTASVDATLSLAQYALVKMKVAPSLEDASAAPIRVAIIDTAIDETHPDLKGVVEQRYDAIGDGSPARSKNHGTAMAGGIAADGELRGVATRVKLLSARALDADNADDAEPRGTTISIVKALDWSVAQKAQVVNMSFAGPDDPTLRDALAHASAQGVALIGAAGNAGPKAPPQYPGADANVIAATATDENDKLYSLANVGAYVAISAPGVDVLLPSPDGGYAMESGTSVSSALISGVVALMLERQPRLKPVDIRQRLTATATPLGGPERAREFGAGLVDASKAVSR